MPRKPSPWIAALKVWNKQAGNGKWVVPKKGTAEYNQVVQIMNKIKGGQIEGDGVIGNILSGIIGNILPF
jgi:hypothetical protein